MAQTIVEKIAQAHLAEGPKRPLRAGDFVSIRPLSRDDARQHLGGDEQVQSHWREKDFRSPNSLFSLSIMTFRIRMRPT